MRPHIVGSLRLPIAAAVVALAALGASQDGAPAWPRIDLAGRTVEKVLSIPAEAAGPAVLLEHRTQPLALAGVSWPEDAEQRRVAAVFLDNLVRGDDVYVVPIAGAGPGADSGTASAYLFRAPDGLFVNLELLRVGYARASDTPHEHARVFRHYGRRAVELRKGVWRGSEGLHTAAPQAIEPGAPSQPDEAGGDAMTVFVTKSGKKYHRKGCQYLTDSARAISLREARARYSPCSRCKPPP